MTNQNSSDGWQACPSGTLERLASRAQRRVFLAAFAKRSLQGAAILTLLIGTLSGLKWRETRQLNAECRVVGMQLPAYLRGELNEAQIQLVESHLANCPRCRRKLAEMQAESDLSFRSPNRFETSATLAQLLIR